MGISSSPGTQAGPPLVLLQEASYPAPAAPGWGQSCNRSARLKGDKWHHPEHPAGTACHVHRAGPAVPGTASGHHPGTPIPAPPNPAPPEQPETTLSPSTPATHNAGPSVGGGSCPARGGVGSPLGTLLPAQTMDQAQHGQPRPSHCPRGNSNIPSTQNPHRDPFRAHRCGIPAQPYQKPWQSRWSPAGP